MDPRAEIVAQILHRTQDCCIAATHIEHAVGRSGGIDIAQQLTEVGFMFGLGNTRGPGDEVAVRLGWRQGVGASVHHCLDLAHDQAQGNVVTDQVMVQQCHQPLFLPGIVSDIRGYQRCLLQVQAHMVGIGAFAQHLQGVFTRRGVELNDWQLCLTMHHLHRLRQTLPAQGAAHDVVAVDHHLQRAEEFVEQRTAVERR